MVAAQYTLGIEYAPKRISVRTLLVSGFLMDPSLFLCALFQTEKETFDYADHTYSQVLFPVFFTNCDAFNDLYRVY